MALVLGLATTLLGCAAAKARIAENNKKTRSASQMGKAYAFSTQEAAQAVEEVMKGLGMEPTVKPVEDGPDSFGASYRGWRAVAVDAAKSGGTAELLQALNNRPAEVLRIRVVGKWDAAFEKGVPDACLIKVEALQGARSPEGQLVATYKDAAPGLKAEALKALDEALAKTRAYQNEGAVVQGDLAKVEAAVRKVLASFDPEFSAKTKAEATKLGPGGFGLALEGWDKREGAKGGPKAGKWHLEHLVNVRFHQKWDASMTKAESGACVLQVSGKTYDASAGGFREGERKLSQQETEDTIAAIKAAL